MDIDSLSKKQVVLLVLLVSFVTSLVTGIVTVTLMSQAPTPITQTIHKVIEKITPLESQWTQSENPSQPAASVAPLVASQEELVVRVVSNVSNAVVSVIASKDLPVIEEYFINPFKEDELFKNLPEGFLPNVQIPQYRQKGTIKKEVSSGTGFFISKDGLLLTNKHVVEDSKAEYSIIMNDGRKFDAKVLAKDPFQDIAILQVENTDKKEFSFIPLGDSDNLKVGQTVIAIGNSLGEFRNTVSVGIVSGLNRSVTAQGSLAGSEFLQEMIQTDAAINPGNSGGPLLDLSGRVVGMNTAVASSAENIGFTLPINVAKRDINDAIEFGKIKYPYLGIRYKVVENGLLLEKGLQGEPAVDQSGPGAKAGLKEGDIVFEIERFKINEQNNLAFLLSKRRVGDKIELKFLREGKENVVSVALEERPENL
ncbi:trypsin-like peptidase domain-containing protein [Patescibacteria group bacterium]|nr:trypsin-like peptidase domain-containing protein [Patescibacteria group bacterium]MBU4353444.1 trypsin-like peptidase domain-containing protein [Patescibacteria group bacterium]MBU4477006.1 trypsin-like peptidase domain-containing protein [Patescibacteria group bacterium]MCG2698893.1 trypsin-like peptidase domain-containing protein [Candidatus Parcubacteria bacterium]